MTPTADQQSRALQVAMQMRDAQRHYYRLKPQSDDKREALIKARMLESEFDKMTHDWQIDN